MSGPANCLWTAGIILAFDDYTITQGIQMFVTEH